MARSPASPPSGTSPATASTTSRAGSSPGPTASAPRRRCTASASRSAISTSTVGGVSIGFEICEDAWVANRPGASLSLHGVDVILNPSASHFAFGKHDVRKRFVLEGSRAFGCTYVYANLLGNEAGRVDLRRRRAHRLGRRPARAGTALPFRTAAHQRGRRCGGHPHVASAQRQLPPDVREEPEGRVSRRRSASRASRARRRRRSRAEPWEPAARTKRKRSSRAPRRWRSSITCARAAPRARWSRSAAAPTRPPSSSPGPPGDRSSASQELGVERFSRHASPFLSGSRARPAPDEIAQRLLTLRLSIHANSRAVTREAARAVASAPSARSSSLFDVDRAGRRLHRHDHPQALGRAAPLGDGRHRRCRTSRPARAPPASGCSPTCATAAALDEQPQRGRGRLRHHGRRHQRRARAHRRHRQELPPPVAPLAGNRGTARIAPVPRARRRQRPAARPPSCARWRPARPTRPI